MIERKIHPLLCFFIVAILIALGIAGYFWLNRNPPEVAETPEKIILGVETSILPAAVWVAEQNGYFRSAGLDVTIKEFDSGRLSFLNMLSEGGVDISTVAPTPIMFNSFQRQDFAVLATFVYSYNDVKVIAHADKGITGVSDLKGKKIGTPAGTTGQFFVESFLMRNEISTSEVKVLDIAPSNLPNALKTGEVDAIVIWEPHAFNAIKLLQSKAIRLPSSDIYKETFNFMVMKKFAADNPKVLEKFLRAIDQATSFIKNHKIEAQQIVAERLKLDKETITTLWDDFVFKISLERSLILTLEDEARWAIKNELTETTTIPNYLNYIYPDALQKVKPEAVLVNR